jgi:hypothetical protein
MTGRRSANSAHAVHAIPALLIFLLAASVPPAVRAQQPHSLSDYWNLLSAPATTAEVLAVPLPPYRPGSADSLIVSGLQQLRLYEVALDRSDAFIAARTLERAVDAAPSDPWSHFALGVMLARGPDVRARAFAGHDAYLPQRNSNAAARAPRELRRALDLDPAMDAAALAFGQLALDLRDARLMHDALEVLTAPPRQTNGAALLLAARLQNALEAHPSAERLARAAARHGADPSVALHEAAVALFRMGEADSAATTYMEGLRRLTDAGSRTYFAAVALLLTPAEALSWHRAATADRPEWLTHFWEERAALSGVPVARRLAEHYRRLEQTEDAGPVMLGIPDTIGSEPNLLTLLVGTKPAVEEAHLGVASIIRYGDSTRISRYLFCAPGWDTLPPPMQPTAAECRRSPYGRMRAKHMNRLLMLQARDRAAVGEGYYPAYEHDIAIAWEALQFRAPGGGAEVVAAVGVPAASAAALRNAAGDLEPVVTVSLVDTAVGWIRTQTSHADARAAAIAPGSMLLLRAATDAPAGREVALRITVENATATAGVVAAGTITVDSFDPDALTLSDVVVSPPDAAGTFRRGDVLLALAPARSYRAGEVPTLYYEVYGAAGGESLDTEITITPVRESLLDRMRAALGRDDGAVSLGFRERAGPPDPVFGLQQVRTVALNALLPGLYDLRVTVTAPATGRTATRHKLLEVTGGMD